MTTHDPRYGLGRSLIDCTPASAEAVLDAAVVIERDPVSETLALERSAWSRVTDEHGEPYPAPTVESLRSHRDTFMPSIHHLQPSHRASVHEVADIYGIDMNETVSKDALGRSLRKGR